MSELEDAMFEHMAYLNFSEGESFSYLNFMPFTVDGRQYCPKYGTIRNILCNFRKEGKIKKYGKGRPAYYQLTEINLDKKSMTHTHTGVSASLLSSVIMIRYTQNSRTFQWTSKASMTYA